MAGMLWAIRGLQKAQYNVMEHSLSKRTLKQLTETTVSCFNLSPTQGVTHKIPQANTLIHFRNT